MSSFIRAMPKLVSSASSVSYSQLKTNELPKIGLVPVFGGYSDSHTKLIEIAKKECDFVTVSLNTLNHELTHNNNFLVLLNIKYTMSTITHFISPQVIDVDNVDTKIEAIIDFVPIPVHAIYNCNLPIQIQCVNITPLDDNASYQIQDLSGNALSSSDLETLFTSLLPYMRHADVSGNGVVEPSLLGSNLTIINEQLGNLINPTNNEDRSGNFNIKKEVFKSLSSYITNHTSLSLTSTIVDLSGTVHEQLNASNHISTELKRLETVLLDVPGDDTKPYLNALLDVNNSNEVFGMNTLKQIIFIVSTDVSINTDTTKETGLDKISLSAVSSVTNRPFFSDEVGPDDPLDNAEINGKWYAALCFTIDEALEQTNNNGTVASGQKVGYKVTFNDLSTGNTIHVNSTKTDENGFFTADTFVTDNELVEVVCSNEDGTGYDSITLEYDSNDTLSGVYDPTSSSFMVTPLTSLVAEYSKASGVSSASDLSTAKSEIETKLGLSSGLLDVNAYDTTTSSADFVAIQEKITLIDTVSSTMGLGISSNSLTESEKMKKIRKALVQVITVSSTTVDFTNASFISDVVDEVDSELTSAGVTVSETVKNSLKSGLSVVTQVISSVSSESLTSEQKVLKFHERKKQVTEIIRSDGVQNIEQTTIENRVVSVATSINYTIEPTGGSSGSSESEPESNSDSATSLVVSHDTSSTIFNGVDEYLDLHDNYDLDSLGVLYGNPRTLEVVISLSQDSNSHTAFAGFGLDFNTPSSFYLGSVLFGGTRKLQLWFGSVVWNTSILIDNGVRYRIAASYADGDNPVARVICLNLDDDTQEEEMEEKEITLNTSGGHYGHYGLIVGTRRPYSHPNGMGVTFMLGTIEHVKIYNVAITSFSELA